ncbi:hypothetical protein OKW43_004298 [Paraburkholderia sp. WC7.3g]|uniref:hypothetical protein n=1 Tax=Paraburkholderia sp. WC7.3g TaxID=2991070 RepID=UPI003D21B746
MTTARQQLLDMVVQKDGFDQPHPKIFPLQLEAAQEYFSMRRQQVSVLDKRAKEMGVESINGIEDIAKVLFAHTNYKSYPQAFMEKGQWKHMTRWLQTLSVESLSNVELEGVANVDEWLDRLWAAGHLANTTSGTSGKVSVLNRTARDLAFYERCYTHATAWPTPLKPEQTRHFFMMGPRRGPYMFMIAANTAAELFARPDSCHFLSDEPMRLVDVTRMASLRRAIADGSATPKDIAGFEQANKQQAERNKARFDEMVEMIIALRHEPLYITGPWLQIWRVMERAREMGVKDGEFHPETVISSGGGLKGVELVPNWYEELFKFFGNVRRMEGFGMSEMSFSYPKCEAGNYHQAPWIMPVLFDGSGVNLVDTSSGEATGRFSFLDMGQEGRWGGMISSDKVTMNFSGNCPCGRHSAYMKPEISRFHNVGEEDKIGCAGTIDSYVRSSLQA